jgi:ABC-type polysaccharide/polyol phosphate export permease
MTELIRILRLARNDFSYFFRTKWLMAILLSLHLSDMLIVSLVYGNLITGFNYSGLNYFGFFVPGVVIMGLFVAALDTGRRIWLALREGVVQYYLSLPISLNGIVAAYLLAGGLAAIVYSTSLLLIALIVLTPQAIVNILILLPFLFVLAVGLAGISASLAALASTHGEYFFAYQQIVQVSLLTLSTVFYPLDTIAKYLPAPLVSFVSANPLSLAAQAMRDYAFVGNSIQPMFLVQILVTSLPFAVIGALSYLTVLRMIQARGKL